MRAVLTWPHALGCSWDKTLPRNPSISPQTPQTRVLLAAGIEVQPDVVLTGIITNTEGPVSQLELREVTSAAATPVVTKQLIFRRGLAMAAAVAALALGIAVKMITGKD